MDRVRIYPINKEQLPLVMEPRDPSMTLDELKTILRDNNSYFRKILLQSGGILLRGFAINDIDAFSAIVETLNLGKFVDYIGGDSPRDKIKGGVYTSTEAPPSFKIPLHNELSFVKHYPKHIYFYCGIPPEKDGETIIADSRRVYKTMKPDVLNRFVEQGIKYVSCYYGKSSLMDFLNKHQRSHKPWRDVFETTDREEVEEKCRQAEFEYKWHKQWIQISQTRPAVMKHAETGEDVWFNQAHLYDFNPKLLGFWRYIGAKAFYCRAHTRLHEVYFPTGEKIPRPDLYSVMDTLDDNTIYFPWRKNDLLVLDNVLSMHGRAPFTGKRRIYTAMTA
jgi:alpha-ketoglutarate-dependent taurine dioxygenase